MSAGFAAPRVSINRICSGSPSLLRTIVPSLFVILK